MEVQLALVSARQESMHRSMEAQARENARQMGALNVKLDAVLQRLPVLGSSGHEDEAIDHVLRRLPIPSSTEKTRARV
jgi:hypothetical protein